MVAGEIIDGGEGSDFVRTHLTRAELTAAGVELRSVSIEAAAEVDSSCEVPPFEEGPFASPAMKLSWDDLPNPNTVYTTTNSQLDLLIENESDDSRKAKVQSSLLVQGYAAELESSTITISGQSSSTYTLDIEDFIPGGINTSEVHPDLLDLKTSAILHVRVEISDSGGVIEHAYAPALYGHLTNSGGTMVVYRSEAYAQIYGHGDLMAGARQYGAYAGPGSLLGRVEFGVKQ